MFCIYGTVLCSCYVKTTSDDRDDYDYLQVFYEDNYEKEQEFLKSFLEEQELESLGIRLFSEEKSETVKPTLFIHVASSWDYEHVFGYIPISKTYFVPQEDALAGRKDTTLAACTSGKETLIPLNTLKPPCIALLVDGLSAEREAYPLIKSVGIQIKAEFPADTEGDEQAVSERHIALQNKVQKLEEMVRAVPKPLLEERPEIVWIVAGGDVMLERGAGDILLKEGPQGIFGGTAELLSAADLALINLEGVVSNQGTKVQKSYNFRFDPKVAPALQKAGIDAVLLANNHAFDYGMDGFLDSLNHLDKAGIGVLGAGIDVEAASRPFMFTKENNPVWVFGIASFPREKNGWDGLNLAAAENKPGMLHAGKGGREKLKSQFSTDDTSLDIVMFHGGEEWSKQPNAATRELYTDLIRQGADVIIGSHPHVVQGFEWILDKPVFWSLGNYVFGGMDNTDGGEDGLFIRLGFLGNRMVYFEPYPLILSHTRTRIGPEKNLDRFYQASKKLRGE